MLMVNSLLLNWLNFRLKKYQRSFKEELIPVMSQLSLCSTVWMVSGGLCGRVNLELQWVFITVLFFRRLISISCSLNVFVALWLYRSINKQTNKQQKRSNSMLYGLLSSKFYISKMFRNLTSRPRYFQLLFKCYSERYLKPLTILIHFLF